MSLLPFHSCKLSPADSGGIQSPCCVTSWYMLFTPSQQSPAHTSAKSSRMARHSSLRHASSRRSCLLIATLALTAAHYAAAQGIFQVHASGASQAGEFMRSAMSIITGRARAPIHATYREIGTDLAQEEFDQYQKSVNNINNIKIGDAPLPSTRYTAITTTLQATGKKPMQIPFAVGSTSVFYNQQVPTFALQLSACILAKIYTNVMTSWLDPEITEFNTYGNTTDQVALAQQLPYMNKNIVAFAYAKPTSTAYTFSKWLETGCVSEDGTTQVATGVTGAYQPTFINVTTTYNNAPINTPEQMAAAIAGTPNSIGFLPTNIGVAKDLDEARIQNFGGAATLMAGDDKGHLYLTNAVKELWDAGEGTPNPIIPRDSSVSWEAVHFSQVKGSEAYPMTNLLYFYVPDDMRDYGNSSALAKRLLQWIFSSEGTALLLDSSLVPLPAKLFEQSATAVNDLIAESPAWEVENALDPDIGGMELQTLSALRFTGEQDQLQQLRKNLTELSVRLSTGIVVRVAATRNGTGGPIMRTLMDELSSYASYPVRFVVENSADFIAQTNLLTPAASSNPEVLTRLLLLDQPLPQDRWTELGAAGTQVLQMPMAVRPLSLLYSTGANTSVPGADSIPNLKISACTLAKILQGQVTKWNDGAITGDNGGLNLPGNDITLYCACTGRYCGAMQAVVNYVNTACPGSNLNVDQLTAPVNTQFFGGALADLIANVANPGVNTSYTGLAIASSDWALEYAAFGLKDAALQGVGGSGGWIRASQMTPAQFTDLAASKLGRTADPSAEWDIKYAWEDWSAFTMAGATLSDANAVAYPLARLDFLAFPADLDDMQDAGGPLQGLLTYIYNQWQTSGTLASMYPDIAPLPSQVYQWAASSAVTVTRIATGAADWPVLPASSETKPNSRPFVLSYLPSTASSTTESATLNQLKVTSLAAQTAQLAVARAALATQESSNTASLASYTYGIAIASLIIVLILAVAGLIIAVISLRDARRALALVSGNGPRPASMNNYPSSSAIVSPARARQNVVFGCLPVGGSGPATKYEVFGNDGNGTVGPTTNGHTTVNIDSTNPYAPAPKP